MFNVTYPLFLILLAAVPLLILARRGTNVTTAKWRRWVTLCLRGGALFCAVLALANLQKTHREQRLSVVFLLDTSDSVAREQRAEALDRMNTAIAKLKPTDRFGLIGFAAEPAVLLELRSKAAQPPLTTDAWLAGEGTDILAAIKRAMVMLVNAHQPRIVIFSDGLDNASGTALIDYLPLLKASNVEILTVPLQSVQDALRVHQLQLPTQVRKAQRFRIQAIIATDGSIPTLTATLSHNGVPIHEAEWTLPRGRHVLELPVQQVKAEGIHAYHLKLNVSDAIPENNHAYGVVKIQDKPHVLYVEGEPAYNEPLKEVLEENGFIVEHLSAAEIPTELVALQRSDALILSNIPADALSTQQLNTLDNYVRVLGHGLVVIGGPRAFGPGGYTDTALERILPVKMTPRQQQDSLAMLFVIDTSGSMANYVNARQKIQLAIEGVRAGIRNLKTEDMAGLLGFNTAVHVVSSLTADRGVLLRAVGTLRPTGGTTMMHAALQEAGEMLKTTDAKRKHIVLLSDGNSIGERSDFLDLAKQLAAARIGITTIAIGDADKTLLSEIAEAAAGNAVFVQNVQELPAVLTETVRETQRYIVQETFLPRLATPDAPIVEGIGSLPMLHGYVATAEKESAQVFIRSHQDEPILAGWRFGLGKSIAWTSDVKPAWAKEWIPWQHFGRFWGQVVNWTLPADDADTDFELTLSSHSGKGHSGKGQAVIDTQRPSHAAYRLHIARPDASHELVAMQQLTPTRYAGNFQIAESGAYLVTAQREEDNAKRTETLSFAYPAEYAAFGVNAQLLQRLGHYEPSASQIAQRSGEPVETRVSLAQALLVVAVILFVAEMIFRRFSIASGYFAELWARLRGPAKEHVPETLTRLRNKKAAGVPATPTASARPVAVDEPMEAGSSSAMGRLLDAKRKARSVS